MPTATSTKSTANGTKRKGAPVKEVHVKQSKKPKFDSAPKSAMKEKVRSKSTKQIEELSESESEDSDEDGGAPLFSRGSDDEDIEESDTTEDEEIPKVEDGLHPERAKAVVLNSKILTQLRNAFF